MRLSTDAAERKALPIYSGCLAYFPAALVAVAELSRVGNDQHNPGKPMQWDRSKSGDELDALTRHLLEAGTIDSDGIRHSTKVAWRALANLQKEIENEREVCTGDNGGTPDDRRCNAELTGCCSATSQCDSGRVADAGDEAKGRDADYLGSFE